MIQHRNFLYQDGPSHNFEQNRTTKLSLYWFIHFFLIVTPVLIWFLKTSSMIYCIVEPWSRFHQLASPSLESPRTLVKGNLCFAEILQSMQHFCIISCCRPIETKGAGSQFAPGEDLTASIIPFHKPVLFHFSFCLKLLSGEK